MMAKLRSWGALFLVLTVLLASCTSTPAQAPASNNDQLPSTGATATAPSTAATLDPATAGGAGATGGSTPTSSGVVPSTSTGSSASGSGVTYVLDPSKSEASYLVREQLARLNFPSDAVGKTNAISGSITLNPDGSFDPASSKFTVDLSSLASDSSMRDNYVRRNILQTGQYPQAVFVPSQASGLPATLPSSGSLTFQLTGDMTIQNVTKPVTWDVTATLNNGEASGTATTSFTFEDFGLSQPRVPVVLSVVDKITLNVTFSMQPSGGSPATGSGSNTAPATGAQPAEAATQPAPTQPAQAAAAPACSSPAALTPALTEGPYFKANSPERASLLEAGMPGMQLTLTGYVLTVDCKPVANALLDFWQADSQGQYDNAGYTLRGHQYTDATGRYQLETVVPGLYPGRTEHIHVKVQAPNGPVLTTQLFFPGVQNNASDGIYNQALLIQVQSTNSASMQAAYNFIVNP